MKRTPAEKVIRFIIIAAATIYIGLMIFGLSSCMSIQKATNYLDEKGVTDSICAAKFPVMPTPPDTTYLERKVVDDSLLKQLEDERDYLLKKLGYLENLPSNIDSAACNKILDEYIAYVQATEQKINKLETKLRSLKATDTTIKKTKIDSAALSALRSKFNRTVAAFDKEKAFLQSQITKVQSESDRYKARGDRLNGLLWKSGGLNLLFILLIGLSIYLKIKKGAFNFINPFKRT